MEGAWLASPPLPQYFALRPPLEGITLSLRRFRNHANVLETALCRAPNKCNLFSIMAAGLRFMGDSPDRPPRRRPTHLRRRANSNNLCSRNERPAAAILNSCLCYWLTRLRAADRSHYQWKNPPASLLCPFRHVTPCFYDSSHFNIPFFLFAATLNIAVTAAKTYRV